MKDKISCVYKISNKLNGKVYVGETSDFKHRRRQHINMLKNKCHENPKINEDLKTYSVSDFSIDILEVLPNNKQIRLLQETYYINLYGGVDDDRLYNYKDVNRYNKTLLTNMSIGRKNIEPWNKGTINSDRQTNCLNTKYRDKKLINDLCNSYKVLRSYGKVAEKFNMQKGTVHRLITNEINKKLH